MKGSRQLSEADIAKMKRPRIMEAAARLVCEKGIDGTSISHLVKGAGVISRKTYYLAFEGKDDCLEQTLAWIGETVREEIRQATVEVPAAIESPTRRGVRALLDFSAEHADRAVFYLLHGPAISLSIYEAEQEAFAELLSYPLGPEPAARRMIAGGISWTLRNLLVDQPKADPRQLLDGFVDLIEAASQGDVVTPLRSECPDLVKAAA